MVSNGYVPTSQMVQVDGWAWLAPGAAHAWQLFAYRVEMATGLRPTITRPDGAYRSYARQVWWRLFKGRGAAVPGTSNHGLGLAVDISNFASYWHGTLDAVARSCNFRFDVAGEPWHIHYLGAPQYGVSTAGVVVNEFKRKKNPMLLYQVSDKDGVNWLVVFNGKARLMTKGIDDHEWAQITNLHGNPVAVSTRALFNAVAKFYGAVRA